MILGTFFFSKFPFDKEVMVHLEERFASKISGTNQAGTNYEAMVKYLRDLKNRSSQGNQGHHKVTKSRPDRARKIHPPEKMGNGRGGWQDSAVASKSYDSDPTLLQR